MADFAKYPALHGMIEQLRYESEKWTSERRDEWLGAFFLVLDYSFPTLPQKGPASMTTYIESPTSLNQVTHKDEQVFRW